MSTAIDHNLSADTIVPFLAGLFSEQGEREYLGEPVTIAQHMLQGACLAEERGLSDEIIVAALLHDVGHFTSALGTFAMNDTMDRHHEDAGADILEPFFPPIITACVRHHVSAKRYLCAVDPDYLSRLSDASVRSLELQGGPMSADEVAAFEALPDKDAIVSVRLLDDEGKVIGFSTPDFNHYRPKVQAMVDRHRAAA